MSIELSKKLHQIGPNQLKFWCPGCEEAHVINFQTGKPEHKSGWSWNGDAEKPTFQPSVLIRTGCHCLTHKPGDDCWCTFNEKYPGRAHFKCGVCHSFVTNGMIHFLNDCTHELSGQTVELSVIPS